MIVGDDSKFPLPEATMMIGRCTNLDAQVSFLVSLESEISFLELKLHKTLSLVTQLDPLV